MINDWNNMLEIYVWRYQKIPYLAQNIWLLSVGVEHRILNYEKKMKWLEGVHCNIIWFDFPVITMQTTVGKNPTKISSGSEKCNIQIFDTIFFKKIGIQNWKVWKFEWSRKLKMSLKLSVLFFQIFSKFFSLDFEVQEVKSVIKASSNDSLLRPNKFCG